MQILKSLTKTIIGSTIALMVSFHALAQAENNECSGNWYINVNTTSSVEDQKGQKGVWIPATVSLDRELAKCADKMLLKQPEGGKPTLNGPMSSHHYQFKNAARQDLKIRKTGVYVLNLSGQPSVDFWIYAPSARTFSPGDYKGIIEARLNGTKIDKSFTQTHAFNFQVKPYVRAKLINTHDDWLKPTGTSVRVHLGDLTQRNRREIPVYMESNGFVSIAFSSQNKGQLVNTTSRRNQVPYQLHFADQSVNLTDEVTFNAGNRPFRGKKVTIAFENTASPYARAGQYEDVVTINMFAR
ncbi:hypothetical protein [Enterovibrio sp. 27052020O]|uniref:hypothetical protein n=1 Tax=Enterovibrio sp. 27052020O TaxID=3241166 RepID=UPI00388F14CA